jgi:glycosyltransferase involved in cell wall biosynthesis
MRVALVHDYLIRFGGAERVVLALRKIFPQAPIYTLLYDQEKMEKYFQDAEIRASFLQKIPFLKNHHRLLAPLMPSAIESLDLREFDLVISSSSAFAKGLVLRPKTIHICYCHSPTRFLWDCTYEYRSRLSGLRKILFHYLRMWDRAAANRVDYFIANSKTTAQRIKKYYGRQAKIIYPPVSMKVRRVPFGNVNFPQQGWLTRETSSLSAQPQFFEKKLGLGETMPAHSTSVPEGTLPNLQESTINKSTVLSSKEYFLIVSQLTPYKRIDLAIKAFNKLELPLIIIGEGRDKKRLQKIAGQNIKFLGWQPDEIVREYYQNCLAFIFPGEDDFGIAPVEAMSFGKPVLAYRKGGATETILEGITGEFFDDPAPEALADGIRRLINNLKNYSPLVISKRAEKFSEERFEKEIKEFVKDIVEKKKAW